MADGENQGGGSEGWRGHAGRGQSVFLAEGGEVYNWEERREGWKETVKLDQSSQAEP